MDDESHLTSIDLQRWHDGDESALKAILERHIPLIRRIVRHRMTPLLRKKADSEDFVQDVLLQFLRNGPRFLGANDRCLHVFFYRVVENALHDKYDWYRAQRRDVAREQPLPSDTVLRLDGRNHQVTTPSLSMERNEREAWVRLALELLDPDDREIIILRGWKELAFSEIGKRLEIKENAARMRHRRAIARLGKAVESLRQGELEEMLA